MSGAKTCSGQEESKHRDEGASYGEKEHIHRKGLALEWKGYLRKRMGTYSGLGPI